MLHGRMNYRRATSAELRNEDTREGQGYADELHALLYPPNMHSTLCLQKIKRKSLLTSYIKVDIDS